MTRSLQVDNKIQNLDRRAKGGSLSRAEFSQSPIARRPPPFGRRGQPTMGAPACVAPFQRTLAEAAVGFSKNLWRLASRCLKMSPNFLVEPLPSAKSVQIGCGAPASFGAPLHCPTFYACMRPFVSYFLTTATI